MIRTDPRTSPHFNWYGIHRKGASCRFADDLLERIGENASLLALSRHLPGTFLSFQTDATRMSFDVRLAAPMVHNHMTATAEGGFDLYVLEQDGWTFYDSIRPSRNDIRYHSEVRFVHRIMRAFRLYFPLYSSVEHLEILFPDGASIRRHDDEFLGRALIYGTSITQGACASRPGLNYPSIIGRRLGLDVINYGFSGNAFLEPSVADAINRIDDLDLIIIDAEANAGPAGVLEERMGPFIDRLRFHHERAMILVLGRIPFLKEERDDDLALRRRHLKAFQTDLIRTMDSERVAFLEGDRLLADPRLDTTVDGIHLNDLGFHLFSENLIREILRVFPRLSKEGIK
ncbi:MAG: SGNH/GDSL hydrolase family protein [Acholeplasmataceae bacterium]